MRRTVGKSLLFMALIASPFIMVRALSSPGAVPAAALLAGLQGYGLACLLPGRYARALGVAFGAILATLVMEFPATVLAVWPGVPHATIYAVLLSVFVRSLGAGRDPVISRFACMVRGPLPPELARYTRQVTILWTVFFAGQIIASALLLALAPRPAWIWFVTVLNLPLLLALFMAEYAWRCWRWRHYPRESLGDMARLFGAVRADLAKGSAPR